MTSLTQILALAFDEVPGEKANEAIAFARSERDPNGGDAVSYEVVMPPGAGVEWLSDTLLPRLVYFLDCRGSSLASTGGVFVSLFAGERLYFFDPGTLVEATRGERTLAELIEAYGSQSTPG